MSDIKYIDAVAAADLLGVKPYYLLRWCRYVVDFPQPVKNEMRHWLFDRAAVIRWAKTHDIKRDFVAGRRRAKAGSGPQAFNEQAALFLSGRCKKRLNNETVVVPALPSEQQQQLDYRKLIARTTNPKTTRVHLVPDWMREDDDRSVA